MTREEEVVRAETSLVQGANIRLRLLGELTELETTLRGMRKTIEALPEISTPVATPEGKPKAIWKLWKN